MNKNFSAGQTKGFKVLIIDDEAEMTDAIAAQLPTTWKIDRFNNSRDAVTHYSKNPHYNVVVTDFKMPIKSGEGLIFDIKYINANQKIFILTGDPSKINLPADFDIKVFEKPEGITLLAEELIRLSTKPS